MKKIIESELISIAHRILKLKDKSDIEALYNESRNVFEKISVLRFYENNKFRIDPLITEKIIETSLFSNDNYENVNKQSDSNPETIRIEKLDKQDFNNSMSLDLINELIEETENSEIISFEDEVHQKAEN